MSNLLDLAKSLGLNPSNENGGNNGIYNPKHFENVPTKKIKSVRKKLRDNYVIPMLESICAIKDKKEFDAKKAGFIALYNELFILQDMDFSAFGMLRNNNAKLAENAKKVWEKFNVENKKK